MRLRCLVSALVAGSLGPLAQPALAATPTTFTDPSRDAAAGAPELTTVVVSNDDAGTIRFRVNVDNQRRLGRDASIELYVDSDQNPTTGDPLSLGADYRVVVDGASQSFEFGRWDGARFDPTTPGDTVRVWYWSGPSISVNRSELGGTGALSFWVRAAGPEQASDAAPDRGTWAYQLQAGGANPPDIEVFYFRSRPAVPRAGAAWELRVDSIRLVGAAARIRPDGWTCSATLTGKRLRGTGPTGCRFRLPKSARGKKLVAELRIVYMGEVVTGTVTYRVR